MALDQFKFEQCCIVIINNSYLDYFIKQNVNMDIKTCEMKNAWRAENRIVV